MPKLMWDVERVLQPGNIFALEGDRHRSEEEGEIDISLNRQMLLGMMGRRGVKEVTLIPDFGPGDGPWMMAWWVQVGQTTFENCMDPRDVQAFLTWAAEVEGADIEVLHEDGYPDDVSGVKVTLFAVPEPDEGGNIVEAVHGIKEDYRGRGWEVN